MATAPAGTASHYDVGFRDPNGIERKRSFDRHAGTGAAHPYVRSATREVTKVTKSAFLRGHTSSGSSRPS